MNRSPVDPIDASPRAGRRARPRRGLEAGRIGIGVLAKGLAVLLPSLLALCACAQAVAPSAPLRMYALDCGRIDFSDMRVFSDTGEHDGESGAMPVSCFLIRHDDDWLLWDAGLGDEIAASPQGHTVVGLHFRVPRTLASQLAELGLGPDDIRYVALSHLHADHSGNAALFPKATFLISPLELAWASARPAPDGVRADAVAAVLRSRVEPVPGDHDVFGDGSVRLLGTPGHTPGHHSLLVQLRATGAVILSGDAAHFQQNYDAALVPLGNASRADTIASIQRLRGLAAHHRARVVIQHGVDVFDAVPRSPRYLD